jgi:sucrose-6-phosphate hydrolase SacC (GH32 family)
VGPAINDDLLTWEPLPVAIASEEEEEEEEVWTGSAVVDTEDTDDTAGFGRGALVAAYTRGQSRTRCRTRERSMDLSGGDFHPRKRDTGRLRARAHRTGGPGPRGIKLNMQSFGVS